MPRSGIASWSRGIGKGARSSRAPRVSIARAGLGRADGGLRIPGPRAAGGGPRGPPVCPPPRRRRPRMEERPRSGLLVPLALAIALPALAHLWLGRHDLNPSDEGFLWYG